MKNQDKYSTDKYTLSFDMADESLVITKKWINDMEHFGKTSIILTPEETTCLLCFVVENRNEYTFDSGIDDSVAIS